MSDFRDKAKDAMDGAVDIARDQLDTFKKLKGPQQKIILGVIAGVVVIILLWIFWPRGLNVIVQQDTEPGAAGRGNFIYISNYEEFDLGEITVILDGAYEITLEDALPAGQPTPAIYVTDFHPVGNPGGAPPDKNYVPKKVKIITDKGSDTKEIED